MSESFHDRTWRERDHNLISATIAGGTPSGLLVLFDSPSTQHSVSVPAFAMVSAHPVAEHELSFGGTYGGPRQNTLT